MGPVDGCLTIEGIAPMAAYGMALSAITFQNNQIQPINVPLQRKLTFSVWDDQDLENVKPKPRIAGTAVRFMDLIPVNDPPVAGIQDLLTPPPGGCANGIMKATDPDSPVLTYNITCFPGKGNVTLIDINTGEFRYCSDAVGRLRLTHVEPPSVDSACC
jgi:hypothetical protein